MKNVIKQMFDAVMLTIEFAADFIKEQTWDFRQLPYSYEHHKMMQNPKNREAYLRAAHKLIEGSERETVTLEDGRSFIIRMTQ